MLGQSRIGIGNKRFLRKRCSQSLRPPAEVRLRLPSVEDSLERFVIAIFAENPGTGDSTIQVMVQPAGLIG